MSDSDLFASALATLMAAYPSWKGSPETLEVYAAALADVPPETLQAAAWAHIQCSVFFPTVADLRRQSQAIADREQGRPALRSGIEAWGDIISAVAEHGYLRQPHFEDPVVTRLVADMGWENLCFSETMMADRAQFVKAYEQARDREQAERVVSLALPAAPSPRALELVAHVAGKLKRGAQP